MALVIHNPLIRPIATSPKSDAQLQAEAKAKHLQRENAKLHAFIETLSLEDMQVYVFRPLILSYYLWELCEGVVAYGKSHKITALKPLSHIYKQKREHWDTVHNRDFLRRTRDEMRQNAGKLFMATLDDYAKCLESLSVHYRKYKEPERVQHLRCKAHYAYLALQVIKEETQHAEEDISRRYGGAVEVGISDDVLWLGDMLKAYISHDIPPERTEDGIVKGIIRKHIHEQKIIITDNKDK